MQVLKQHISPFSFLVIFLLIIVTIASPKAFASGKRTKIFSLSHRHNPDTIEIKLLISRFKVAERDNPQYAIQIGKQIIVWMKTHDYENEEAFYNNQIGKLYQSREHYNMALKHMLEGFKIYKKLGDIEGQAYSLSDIANIYFAQGFYEMAAYEYKKQLSMFEAKNDIYGAAVAMNNIGLTFQASLKPDSALRWYNKALKLRKILNNPFLIAHSKVYIGKTLIDLKMYDKADSAIKEALYVLNNKKERTPTDSSLMASALYVLGMAAMQSNNTQQSISALEAALKIDQKLGNVKNMIRNIILLDKVYRKESNELKANYYLDQALELSKKGNLTEEYYMALYRKFYLLASAKRDTNIVYYLNELQATSDSMLFARKYSKIDEIKTAVEAMQSEYEVQKATSRNQNRLFVLMTISLLAFIALILFFILYQKEKKNERRFKQLSNATFEGIVIHGENKIIRTNQSFLKLTGFDEQWLLQASLCDIFIDEDRPMLGSLFSEMKQKEVQTTLIDKEGKQIVVEILNRSINFKGKKVNITAIRDISQLKKVLQENRLLLTAVEQHASAVIMTDNEGSISYVNKEFSEVTGYSSAEVIGKKPSIVKSGKHNDVFYKVLWNTIKKGEPWKGEILNKKKNGDLYWENTLITPVKNSKGTKTHFIAIKEDITLRKQNESELQRRKNMYRELVRHLPLTAVFIFDKNHQYLLADGPLLSELGVQSQTYEGKKPGAITQIESDIELINNIMKESLNGFSPVAEITISGRICLIHALPVAESKQDISLGMLVVRDITIEREAQKRIMESEAQLRELNATKDKFFSLLAHDLKNPFNIILGYADILSTDYDELTDQTKKEYIVQIERGAESAFQLLNNLLEWARSQTGQIQFTPQPFDLNIPINSGLQIVDTQAQAKGVKFVKKMKDQAWVYADLNMVRTVIRNLLTNAIKFSYPGSVITVTLEDYVQKAGIPNTDIETNYIMTTIEDQGIGIGPGDLTKLFKTGEKVKTEGTAKETGTGLGLLLCHEFISQNGGRIWVTSQPGSGSKFMFILPVAPTSDIELNKNENLS